FLRLDTAGTSTWRSIVDISVQLLLPFVLGHLSRPLLGRWMQAHPALVHAVDQGSILLVVYTALSASVVAGLWQTISADRLLWLFLVCCVLLTLALLLTTLLGYGMRYSRQYSTPRVLCAT